MLIARLSKRLWLAFPDEDSPDTRQYVVCPEVEKQNYDKARPLIERIVNGTRFSNGDYQ